MTLGLRCKLFLELTRERNVSLEYWNLGCDMWSSFRTVPGRIHRPKELHYRLA
jgi:hypothetical protein